MTPSKRIFDLVVAVVLCVFLVPVIAITALVVALIDGRPVFYISERMRTPRGGFALIKFRTMKAVVADSGVSGGDKTARITKTGAFLRRTRLDELPQLWNVLRGDISFVGPRPPLRQYVERFPDIYAQVLRARPGITGLASVYYHAHEEHLLARCTEGTQTDAVYARTCVPCKARLDLIYHQRRTICYDIRIMLMTVFKRLR